MRFDKGMVAAVAVLALAGCFERETKQGNETGNEAAGNESAEAEGEGEERRSRREADRELLRDIRADLESYRETLPQTTGPMTTTAVELDGSELIYTQRSRINLTSGQVDELEREVRRTVCRGTTGDWIRGGVVMTYRISDPDGDDYRISIDQCPEGSSGGDDRGRSTSRGGDDGASNSGGGNSGLAEELERDVAEFRRTLPQRDGPLTTYDVDLRGTEIIYFQRTEMNLTDETFARFERSVEQGLCRGEGTAQMIRRGGVMSYRITDGEGEVFRTSISSC